MLMDAIYFKREEWPTGYFGCLALNSHNESSGGALPLVLMSCVFVRKKTRKRSLNKNIKIIEKILLVFAWCASSVFCFLTLNMRF